MISITKTLVPVFLRESEFYTSLSCDESEEFNVPAENFKLDARVENFADFSHLMHTLQFWGSSELPIESIPYLVSHCQEEYGQIYQLLDEIDWSSNMVEWFNALHSVKTPQESSAKMRAAIDTLIPFLVGKIELLREHTAAALRRTTVDMAVLNNYIPQIATQILELSSVSSVRDIAKLFA